MSLMNQFDSSSFMTTLLTLFIGFLVVGFTQFIRIWRIDAVVGSYLATITIALAVMSTALLYFLFSVNITPGGMNEKKWARASAKHIMWESLWYFAALFLTPGIRPFWFIGVFIYFNRYPFETYINPKKASTLNPTLLNVPLGNPESPVGSSTPSSHLRAQDPFPCRAKPAAQFE